MTPGGIRSSMATRTKGVGGVVVLAAMCLATGCAAPEVGLGRVTDVPQDVAANSDLGARLDALPLPSVAVRDGDPVQRGNTVEQTYEVEGQDTLSVFVDVLDPALDRQGWESAQGPVSDGDGFGEQWIRDGDTLLIVSSGGMGNDTITVDVLLSVAPTR